MLPGTTSSANPVKFEIIVGKTPLSDLRLDPTTGANLTGCDDPIGSDDDWHCRGYGAASCSLFPCVRTYKTTVNAGSVTEILTEHNTLETLRDRPYWDPTSERNGRIRDGSLVLVNTSCISPEDEQQLLREGHQTDSKWLVYNASNDFDLGILYPPDAAFPSSMVARSCTYAFDDYFMDDGLLNFFFMSGFLQGNILVGAFVCPEAKFLSFGGPSELQVLYHSSSASFHGIKEIFDNMATPFTNYMRIHGHENYSAPAHGIVSHYATCLEVRWAWITLPAFLLAMTMFCLLPLTVCTTSRADVPTWEESLLPLVFRGPLVHREQERQSDDEDEARAPVSTGNSIQDMEERSKFMRVRLSRVGQETRQLELT